MVDVSHQVDTTASVHPENLVESHLLQAEVLGLIPEDRDTKFRRQHKSAHEIKTIDKNLADYRLQHISEDENATAAENISIEAPKDKEVDVRAMLKKYEQDWYRQLCEMNVTEMHIDLKPDAKVFKSPPFRVGPKRRQIEWTEIYKQLREGVIELAMSD